MVKMVAAVGFEPTRRKTLSWKESASANFAIRPNSCVVLRNSLFVIGLMLLLGPLPHFLRQFFLELGQDSIGLFLLALACQI